MEGGALGVDDDLLFLDVKRELHDLGTGLGGLLMGMDEWRCDKVYALARQLWSVSGQRGRGHRER